LLWPHAQAARSDEVRFVKRRTEMRAMWGEGEGTRETRDERMQVERRAVFEALREICDRTPELDADWYAVSPLR
jgi:hypothetical protein